MREILRERVAVMVRELADKGVSQVEIARTAGVTKATVTQWLTADIKSMKLQYALAIERRYGYSHRWLALGDGPKMTTDIGNEKEPEVARRSDFWPFSIPFEQYQRLDRNKKKQLDIRVSEFVEGALPVEPDKSPAANTA